LPAYRNGPAGHIDAAADIVKLFNASSKKAAKESRKGKKSKSKSGKK
jgi:hypothetical protein